MDVCRCIIEFFYFLAKFTDAEIEESQNRLSTGGFCLEATPIPQDQIFKILISAEGLRNDAARVLIDKLQRGHCIVSGSLLSCREVKECAAKLILEQCRLLLTSVYEMFDEEQYRPPLASLYYKLHDKLDEANSLWALFDLSRPEQILS